MTCHVGVDPDPLVLLLPVHHVLVGHVVLMIAPDDVVYGCLVQHRHHPYTLHTRFNPSNFPPFNLFSDNVLHFAIRKIFWIKQ